MAKGRKTGGRQKGARNIASAGIKELLGEVLSDGELKRRWKRWFGHRDDRIAFEAFKLALSYLYGKPVQPVVGEELAPPITIDISDPAEARTSNGKNSSRNWGAVIMRRVWSRLSVMRHKLFGISLRWSARDRYKVSS